MNEDSRQFRLDFIELLQKRDLANSLKGNKEINIEYYEFLKKFLDNYAPMEVEK